MQLLTKTMVGVALVAGCTDTDSTTNLNPVGPPMLRQVLLNHRVFNEDGSSRTPRVFGFGSHELADPDELKSGQISSAVALSQSFRLVIDELLVGNGLEEIACRSAVDDDAFSRVPLGATPDDIARCAVADDVLAEACSGPTAVCICNNAAGCSSATGAVIAQGSPVGVLDINQDGATDDTQMIAGSVGLQCGSISVPISLENSYWNPSGDQNRPAQGGFEALGPAIVLTTDGPLPTNLDCQLTFADDVVDKQGEKICAPANGDINASCSPGDLGAFTFRTEVLNVFPATFQEGQTGVSRTSPLVMASFAPLKGESVTTASNITLVAATGTQPTITVTFDNTKPQEFTVLVTGGMSANTMYTLTITQSVVDTFDQPAPAPLTYTFTTGS